MITSPHMLVSAAKDAGIAFPSEETLDNFLESPYTVKQQYPHFLVFCNVQLGRPMSSWTEHFENARVIAKVANEDIFRITLGELIKLGLRIVK